MLPKEPALSIEQLADQLIANDAATSRSAKDTEAVASEQARSAAEGPSQRG